jgi:hypothetical protein
MSIGRPHEWFFALLFSFMKIEIVLPKVRVREPGSPQDGSESGKTSRPPGSRATNQKRIPPERNSIENTIRMQ